MPRLALPAVKVAGITLLYPPQRNIGSELMTHRLLQALAARGHEVVVHAVETIGSWSHDGVDVVGQDHPLGDPDVVVAHAGISWPGVEHRAATGAPLVMICHNVSNATSDDLAGALPDLIVANSKSMAEALDVDALIVNPPAPRQQPPARGDRVTTLSLNHLKGGPQFWSLVRSMPDVGFLAIKGGYGEQVVQADRNVEVLEHVPHDRLAADVWARTAAFLQLSESESWGMAAAEAIAHGIPVIAHPTPGIVENLADAAVYVDRDDAEGLQAAVRMILADPEPHVARAQVRAVQHQEASAQQLAAWVTAIEGLGDEQAHQRDRATQGALVGSA